MGDSKTKDEDEYRARLNEITVMLASKLQSWLNAAKDDPELNDMGPVEAENAMLKAALVSFIAENRLELENQKAHFIEIMEEFSKEQARLRKELTDG